MIPLLIVCDLAWLGVIMKDFYQGRLVHLASATISWPAALLFFKAESDSPTQ